MESYIANSRPVCLQKMDMLPAKSAKAKMVSAEATTNKEIIRYEIWLEKPKAEQKHTAVQLVKAATNLKNGFEYDEEALKKPKVEMTNKAEAKMATAEAIAQLKPGTLYTNCILLSSTMVVQQVRKSRNKSFRQKHR